MFKYYVLGIGKVKIVSLCLSVIILPTNESQEPTVGG